MDYMHYRGKDANYDEHDHSRMANVLLEAEAIKADKKAMKGVHKHLGKTQKALTSIKALRAHANEERSSEAPSGYAREDGNDPALKTPTKKRLEADDREDLKG